VKIGRKFKENENSVSLLLNSLPPIYKEHKMKAGFLSSTAEAFLSPNPA
jgi:hypothetical protein